MAGYKAGSATYQGTRDQNREGGLNAAGVAAMDQMARERAAAAAASNQSPAYYPSGGGGGYSAPPPPTVHNLNLNTNIEQIVNDKVLPDALPEDATDEQKAQHWMQADAYWGRETEARLSAYNQARMDLARLEMMYPEYSKDQGQSQQILDARARVAQLEASYREAENKANTIDVSVGVGTTRDGDNERVNKTYTITDDTGNTVSTQYSEDNGGMSASELRNKQQQDQQKALNASNARVAAEAANQVNQIQAGAERDYAIGAAQSSLDAYMQQYGRNLQNIDQQYAGDQLQGNQDLLLASNEIGRQAAANSREAENLLSRYNLGGSSLGNRLDTIASDAANNANQIASLTYNQRMREADTNYGDARLALEDQRAQQQNQYNQAQAQAQADFYARMAQQAGQNYEQMAQYANPDYWYGTMFDAQGNRLNSFADMDSQAMRDYANNQAKQYGDYMNQYQQQQQNAANSQTNTKADQYVSDYTAPASRTYDAGLREYKPVNNDNRNVLGDTEVQPRLEREGEMAL